MADSRKRRYVGNSEESSGRKKFDVGSIPGHRFLIPSKAAGAMIGKGGEVIKRLRSEHNCRIIVPDSQGPERLVIIDANPSTIIDVWNDILPFIKEYMNAKECDFKGSSGKYIEGDDEIDLRLIVHESQAGAVIGKGGERIRNLIDEHKMTMIKLYQAFCPDSTDRVVRLVSKFDNVMACLENIFDLLENQAIKGARKDYNPDNFDESNAASYGGFISKDSRFPVRSMNNNQPRRSISDNHYDSGDFLSRPSVFSRVNVNKYDDGVSVVRSIFNPRNNLMGKGGGVTDLLGGVIRMSAVNDLSTTHLSRVSVPSNLVSGIIGKDGRRLNDLTLESGAEIEIEMDRMNNKESIFVLRGSAEQIYKAQCIMQLCVRKFSDVDSF